MRRVVVGAALVVPLIVDPFGADTLMTKTLALGVVGSLALVADGVGLLRPGIDTRTPWAERLLCLLAAWAACSMLWAGNPGLAATRAVALVGMVGVVRAARVGPREHVRGWLMALVAVLMGGVLLDAFAIHEAAGELAPSAAKFSSLVFVHNNIAAATVTVLGPLLVALALRPKRRAWLAIWLACAVGLVVYLEMLGGRGGELGVLVGGAGVLVLLAVRGFLPGRGAMSRGWRLLLALLLVGVALLPFSQAARGHAKEAFYRVVTIAGLESFDVQRRPILWAKGMEMAFEQPLLGVGAGNFPVELPRFYKFQTDVPHAHNDTLQVLAELGLPGLLGFLGVLASTAWLALVALRHRSTAIEAAGLGGAFAVLVVVGLFEAPFALGGTAALMALLWGWIARLGADDPVERGSASRFRPWTLLAGLLALAVSLERLPASWLMARAETAGREGRRQEAYDDYARVAALRTGAHVPDLLMARIRLDQENLEGALVHLQRAETLWPYGSDVLEQQGDVLARLGRAADALECYERALRGAPGRPALELKVGLALDRVGRRREAIDLFEAAVARQPDPAVIFELAKMWQQQAAELQAAAGRLDPAAVEALVAARHFHALTLEWGDAELFRLSAPAFEFLTDKLQRLPGSPDSWWQGTYKWWRVREGWTFLPDAALYSSMGPAGVKIYPGWVETEGPPRPPWLDDG